MLSTPSPRENRCVHRYADRPAAVAAGLPVLCRNWPAGCRSPVRASLQSSPTRKQMQPSNEGDDHECTHPDQPQHPAIHLHGVGRFDRLLQPLGRCVDGRKRRACRLPDHDHADPVSSPAGRSSRRTPLPARSLRRSRRLFLGGRTDTHPTISMRRMHDMDGDTSTGDSTWG